MISNPEVNRTLATLRKAELGFLGLIVEKSCLVVNWEQEEKEKAGASLVEVRANDLIRDFLRIELVKSTISYTRKRYDRTSAGPIPHNRLDRANINSFYSKEKIESLSQHPEAIGT